MKAVLNGDEKAVISGATHIFKKAELKKVCGEGDECPLKIFIDSKVDS